MWAFSGHLNLDDRWRLTCKFWDYHLRLRECLQLSIMLPSICDHLQQVGYQWHTTPLVGFRTMMEMLGRPNKRFGQRNRPKPAPHQHSITSQGKATAEAAPPPDTRLSCRWQGSRQGSSQESNVTSQGKATIEQFYILTYGLHARGNGTGAKPARITSAQSRIRAWRGHRRKASHITSMVLQAGPA